MTDEEHDRIIDEGETVYSQSWDSGAPGAGADVESVLKYDGKYWALTSYNGLQGPLDSLIEALESEELLRVSGATQQIESSKMSEEELSAKISGFGGDAGVFTINGAAYELFDDGSVKKRDG